GRTARRPARRGPPRARPVSDVPRPRGRGWIMRLLRAGSTRASRAAETDKDSPRKREKSKTAKRTGGVSSAVWVIAASIGLSLTAGCRAGRLRGEPAPVPPEVARLVDEAAQRRAAG